MNSRPKEELENISNENGRREGERETFTNAPGTGLVKETISMGAEKLDVRAKREWGRGQRPNFCSAGPGQGNATEVNTAIRAAGQRTEDHGGGSASEHPKHARHRGQLKVNLGKR